MLSTLAVLIISTKKPQTDIPNLLPTVQTLNFDQDFVLPIKEKQAELATERAVIEETRRKSDCESVYGVYSDGVCSWPPRLATASTDSLTGSYGYSLPWGNCVDELGINNPGWGNPISWSVLYRDPHIGSTVLFTWNHTAIVTGIWSNGDVEVRQRNSYGAHRFPRYLVRGYR
jgi:hypothetical protein